MEWVMAIIMLTFSLTMSPGPANILFMTMGARCGWKRTLPLVWGMNISFMMIAILIGNSVEYFKTIMPQAAYYLHVIGILYLLFLAFKLLFLNKEAVRTGQKESIGFWSGFIFQALNPKAWFVNLSIFSVFGSKFDHSLIIINLIVLIVRLVTQNLWVLAGVAMGIAFHNKERQTILNHFLAMLLIFTCLWMWMSFP